MKEVDIYLKRFKETPTSTIGDLTIEGLHQCYVLEDGYNFPKIAKVSRIPAGRYKIILREEGTHHQKYSLKFPDFHVGMLQLEDVQNFQYILIHIGNTVKDTEGCLLVGKKYNINVSDNNYVIEQSTLAYVDLYKKIIELMQNNEVFLNIS